MPDAVVDSNVLFAFRSRHDQWHDRAVETLAFMRRTDTGFVYSFDDDFDRFDGVTRLDSAVDPFDPAE